MAPLHDHRQFDSPRQLRSMEGLLVVSDDDDESSMDSDYSDEEDNMSVDSDWEDYQGHANLPLAQYYYNYRPSDNARARRIALQQCVRLLPAFHPLRSPALHELGLAYEAIGEVSAAEDALQEALAVGLAEDDLRLSEVWLDLGRLQARLGKVTDALDSLAEAALGGETGGAAAPSVRVAQSLVI